MKPKNPYLAYLKKRKVSLLAFKRGSSPPIRTVPFCKECGGACCRWGEGITLRPRETEEFLTMLGGDKRFFDEQGRLLFADGQCPFLSEEGVCTCDKKPQTCGFWSCLHFRDGAWKFFKKYPHVLTLIKKHDPKAYRDILKNAT